eukprot:m.218977 g.218977  ORF g.218977 m.218977 type:complete len:85 (+) comp39917_c0_seq15:97-351(+)
MWSQRGDGYCVDDIESIQENCSDRIDYVISVDNDGSVKDLTARYVSDWLTAARKRQVDSNWWKETLQPYKTSKTVATFSTSPRF